MALIVFAEPWEPGATMGHSQGTEKQYDGPFKGEEWPVTRLYWTKKKYEGRVLKEWEHNGAWDSDFFCLIWDDEKGEPFTVMFATTRGWTYPLFATSVDADAETLAKYEAWQKEQRARHRAQQRAQKAAELRMARKDIKEIASKIGLKSYVPLLRLRRRSYYEWARYRKLLTTNLRSDFKKSLRKQLIEWLKDPAPKYARPLSPKQMEYI